MREPDRARPSMSGAPAASPATAAEALDVAHEISRILDCGLDRESLSVCIALLETGVSPEALAAVVARLRRLAAERAAAAAAAAAQPPR